MYTCIYTFSSWLLRCINKYCSYSVGLGWPLLLTTFQLLRFPHQKLWYTCVTVSSFIDSLTSTKSKKSGYWSTCSKVHVVKYWQLLQYFTGSILFPSTAVFNVLHVYIYTIGTILTVILKVQVCPCGNQFLGSSLVDWVLQCLFIAESQLNRPRMCLT